MNRLVKWWHILMLLSGSMLFSPRAMADSYEWAPSYMTLQQVTEFTSTAATTTERITTGGLGILNTTATDSVFIDHTSDAVASTGSMLHLRHGDIGVIDPYDLYLGYYSGSNQMLFYLDDDGGGTGIATLGDILPIYIEHRPSTDRHAVWLTMRNAEANAINVTSTSWSEVGSAYKPLVNLTTNRALTPLYISAKGDSTHPLVDVVTSSGTGYGMKFSESGTGKLYQAMAIESSAPVALFDFDIANGYTTSTSTIDIDDVYTPLSTGTTYSGAVLDINLGYNDTTATGTFTKSVISITAVETTGNMIDIDNTGPGDFVQFSSGSVLFEIDDEGNTFIGGGYGDAGTDLSATGSASFDGNLIVDGTVNAGNTTVGTLTADDAFIGGGYGDSGVDITATGSAALDGNMQIDGMLVNEGNIVSGSNTTAGGTEGWYDSAHQAHFISNQNTGRGIKVINTYNGANAPSSIKFHKIRVSGGAPQVGVVNDQVGSISFNGADDSGSTYDDNYAMIRVYIDDPTSGAEDGRVEFNCTDDGSITEKYLEFDGSEEQVNVGKDLDTTAVDIYAATDSVQIGQYEAMVSSKTATVRTEYGFENGVNPNADTTITFDETFADSIGAVVVTGVASNCWTPSTSTANFTARCEATDTISWIAMGTD